MPHPSTTHSPISEFHRGPSPSGAMGVAACGSSGWQGDQRHASRRVDRGTLMGASCSAVSASRKEAVAVRAAVRGGSTAATAASVASAALVAFDACGERREVELAEAKMRRGDGSSMGDGAPVKGAAASGAVRGVVDGGSGALRAG